MTSDQITQVIAKWRDTATRIEFAARSSDIFAGKMQVFRQCADELAALLSLHAPGDQVQETPQADETRGDGQPDPTVALPQGTD